MIPTLDPATGWLPLGRYRCTQAEVEDAFVGVPQFSASPTRLQIWRDWQAGLALLQRAAMVHAAWLGGSFTTDKLDPEDLDVAFLINGDDMRRRGLHDRQIITIFASSQVKGHFGLQLDTYAIPWESIPSPQFNVNRFHDEYFWARGHWDDWWQRCRQGSKSSPPTPADALPRRGYLEVPVSDYP